MYVELKIFLVVVAGTASLCNKNVTNISMITSSYNENTHKFSSPALIRYIKKGLNEMDLGSLVFYWIVDLGNEWLIFFAGLAMERSACLRHSIPVSHSLAS